MILEFGEFRNIS